MNVEKYLKSLTELFSIRHQKAVNLVLPLERGHVKTSVEMKKDVQASIKSVLNFTKGKIVANASSDFPSNIKFSSKNMIPFFSIGASIFNDDRSPSEVKSTFHHHVKGYTISQCFKLAFKVLPLSNEMIDRTNIGTVSINKIFDRTKSLKIGYLSDTNTLTFDVFTRSLPNVVYALNMTIGDMSHIGANFISSTKFGSYDASAVFNIETRTLNYIIHHQFDHNINGGLLIGVEHLGRCMKLTGKMATKFNIDKDSEIQLIGGIDGSLSGKFTLQFQDFLNFQFSGTAFPGISGYDSEFGAMITFDLSNREEYQMF